MKIHHFYPKTTNIGDHFVRMGIESLITRIVPQATFQSFNVNDRGDDRRDFGLTHHAVERANREADLMVIGGSNLYEADKATGRWGVHLERQALEKLQIPLFLVGIGTGSDFSARRPTQPSSRVIDEIKALNARAQFSAVRDVVTLDWLRALGVTSVELMGDPATFIYNCPLRAPTEGTHVFVVMPPRRFFWHRTERIRFWDMRGPNMLRAVSTVTEGLAQQGHAVTIACNDPRDADLARRQFSGALQRRITVPASPEEYLQTLSTARAMISGRLHAAVVAFSLGIPFVLIDFDQRSRGFIKTYQLDGWAVACTWSGAERRLERAVDRLLSKSADSAWSRFIALREKMHERALDLLRKAFQSTFHGREALVAEPSTRPSSELLLHSSE